jgi:hypothetical protein
MADFKYWDQTDEWISVQLERIHNIMLNADKVEDISKIQKIEIELLQEQRHRLAMMLNDETEASKLSLETAKAKNSEEAEKKKFKINTILEIAKLIAGLVGSGAAVYGSYKNFEAKKLECATNARNVDVITKLEASGDIPYHEANRCKYTGR